MSLQVMRRGALGPRYLGNQLQVALLTQGTAYVARKPSYLLHRVVGDAGDDYNRYPMRAETALVFGRRMNASLCGLTGELTQDGSDWNWEAGRERETPLYETDGEGYIYDSSSDHDSYVHEYRCRRCGLREQVFSQLALELRPQAVHPMPYQALSAGVDFDESAKEFVYNEHAPELVILLSGIYLPATRSYASSRWPHLRVVHQGTDDGRYLVLKP